MTALPVLSPHKMQPTPPNPPMPKDLPDGAGLEEHVKAVVQNIYDPEIPVNIYDLGLIYNIDIRDGDFAHILMTLTAPNCPAAQSLPEEVKTKVELIEGIREAEVEITFDPPWTPENMDESAKLMLNIL